MIDLKTAQIEISIVANNGRPHYNVSLYVNAVNHRKEAVAGFTSLDTALAYCNGLKVACRFAGNDKPVKVTYGVKTACNRLPDGNWDGAYLFGDAATVAAVNIHNGNVGNEYRSRLTAHEAIAKWIGHRDSIRLENLGLTR